MGIVASIHQEDDKPATDITLCYYISSAKLNAKILLVYRISTALALNALNGETSFKADIKRKQKRASRNKAYLPQSLAGLGFS